jgi:hypothetical protein
VAAEDQQQPGVLMQAVASEDAEADAIATPSPAAQDTSEPVAAEPPTSQPVAVAPGVPDSGAQQPAALGPEPPHLGGSQTVTAEPAAPDHEISGPGAYQPEAAEPVAGVGDEDLAGPEPALTQHQQQEVQRLSPQAEQQVLANQQQVLANQQQVLPPVQQQRLPDASPPAADDSSQQELAAKRSRLADLQARLDSLMQRRLARSVSLGGAHHTYGTQAAGAWAASSNTTHSSMASAAAPGMTPATARTVSLARSRTANLEAIHAVHPMAAVPPAVQVHAGTRTNSLPDAQPRTSASGCTTRSTTATSGRNALTGGMGVMGGRPVLVTHSSLGAQALMPGLGSGTGVLQRLSGTGAALVLGTTSSTGMSGSGAQTAGPLTSRVSTGVSTTGAATAGYLAGGISTAVQVG